jgi:hypothetical protein
MSNPYRTRWYAEQDGLDTPQKRASYVAEQFDELCLRVDALWRWQAHEFDPDGYEATCYQELVRELETLCLSMHRIYEMRAKGVPE